MPLDICEILHQNIASKYIKKYCVKIIENYIKVEKCILKTYFFRVCLSQKYTFKLKSLLYSANTKNKQKKNY